MMRFFELVEQADILLIRYSCNTVFVYSLQPLEPQWLIQKSIIWFYLSLEAKIEWLQRENRIPQATITTMLKLNMKRNIIAHQYDDAAKLHDRRKFIDDAQSVFVTLGERLQDSLSTADRRQLESICGRQI